MSAAIYSADYLASLVQRAQMGMTFYASCRAHEHDSHWDEADKRAIEAPHPDHHWEPMCHYVATSFRGDYYTAEDKDGRHWREWYRETEASCCLVLAIADSPKGWDFDDGGPDGPIQQWSAAQPDDSEDCGTHGAIHALYVRPLRTMLADFEGALYALGGIQP